MTATPVPPDVELVAVNYLTRVGSRVRDLTDAGAGRFRVYTTLPKAADFPLLRVVRFGGVPVRSYPLRLLAVSLQLDAYGGSKEDARRLIDTAVAELADMHTATHAGAVVTAVNVIRLAQYLPDNDFNPPKPRYTADVSVLVHP